MDHWSNFLTFALCHAECMRHTQIALDPMMLAQAMQQAAAQQQRFQGIAAAPQRFDRNLITGVR